MYQYLFAKQDRDNIDDDELAEFRKLATLYERLTDKEVAKLVTNQEFLEICNDC